MSVDYGSLKGNDRVYKYDFQVTSYIQECAIPAGAELISVNNQRNSICAWYFVNPDNPVERRFFKVVGTGQEIDEKLAHKPLGSALFDNGSFVFHLFEVFDKQFIING